MTAVSDTSPLNYLILTGLDLILPRLFGRVVIPRAVFDELSSPKARDEVRSWVGALPEWIEVREAGAVQPGLTHLDAGEREAISLARELAAGVLLLDEAKARQAAAALGLRVVGTLGLLDHAATRGLIDLGAALERLSRTTFRASPTLLQGLRKRRS